MRISDWSSDVCSSDLLSVALYRQVAPPWLSPAPLPCGAPTFLDVVKPRRGHLADSPSPPVSHARRPPPPLHPAGAQPETTEPATSRRQTADGTSQLAESPAPPHQLLKFRPKTGREPRGE